MGENFARFSGEAKSMAEVQVFAWNAAERGLDINLQANPTQTEMLSKKYAATKKDEKKKNSEDLLEKYGGKEYVQSRPPLPSEEHYVEYSKDGKIIKGMEKAIPKSKYEEDQYFQNHTSVWGSYWQEGKWGYRCCHSFVKSSYCVGKE